MLEPAVQRVGEISGQGISRRLEGGHPEFWCALKNLICKILVGLQPDRLVPPAVHAVPITGTGQGRGVVTALKHGTRAKQVRWPE